MYQRGMGPLAGRSGCVDLDGLRSREEHCVLDGNHVWGAASTEDVPTILPSDRAEGERRILKAGLVDNVRLSLAARNEVECTDKGRHSDAIEFFITSCPELGAEAFPRNRRLSAYVPGSEGASRGCRFDPSGFGESVNFSWFSGNIRGGGQPPAAARSRRLGASEQKAVALTTYLCSLRLRLRCPLEATVALLASVRHINAERRSPTLRSMGLDH